MNSTAARVSLIALAAALGCAAPGEPSAASPRAVSRVGAGGALPSALPLAAVPLGSAPSPPFVTASNVLPRPAFDALPDELRRFARVNAAACTVAWSEQGQLAVNGASVTPPEEMAPYAGGEPPIQVPYNERAVLIASRLPYRVRGDSSPRLWLLECTGAHRLAEAYFSERADFSFVLTSSAGRWLYHSAERGLAALDLSTLHGDQPRVNLVLAAAPEYRPWCWAGSVNTPNYLPVAWREPDGVMLLRSEAGCGFESEPESWPLLALDVAPEGQGTRAVELSPLSTVRVDHTGAIWVGDGEVCDGTELRSATSRGTLWRSKDGGTSWGAVEINNGTFGPNEGIVQLEVQGDFIVALSSHCNEMGPSGGDVWWSRDLGKSWQQVQVNEEVFPKDGQAQGPLFEQLQIVSTQPLRIRAFRGQERWEAQIDPKVQPNFEFPPPRGGPWKQKSSAPRPRRSDASATLGATTFVVTERGLERSATKQVVFRTVDYLRAFHFRVGEEAVPETQRANRPVSRPWLSGCHSLAEVQASGEGSSQLSFVGSVTAALMAANDSLGQLPNALTLHALPSTDSHVVASLPLPTGELRSNGNVCRVAGQDWLQLETGEGLGWVEASELSSK